MVGLGDTTKKIQKMIDTAEDTYKKLNELRGQVQELREKVETTSDNVETMQYDLAEQRALLQALVEDEGLDAEQIIADAHIDVADDVAESTDASSSPESGETGDAAGGTAAEPED